MQLKTFALTAACAAGMLAATNASAAVILSIDNATVLPGNTVNVGVYITSNASDVLTGFNLPLDINNDGYVDANGDTVSDLPAGLSLGSPVVANALYADTAYDRPFPQTLLYNVDAIPTGSGADTPLGTTPTKLFDLSFVVDSGVAVGTVFALSIEDLDFPFTGVFTVAGRPDPVVLAPTVGSPVFGSITVVGVPEPTVLAAFGLVAVAGLRRRRA